MIPNKEFHDQEILLSEETIKARLQEQAKQIAKDYEGKPILLVSVLKGGLMVTSDLMRELHKAGCTIELDFIQTQSYEGIKKGQLNITKDVSTDLSGTHILLIDDVFDTGDTMEALHNNLAKRGTASVRSFVLLEKRLVRKTNYKPNYIGFSIPNVWVEGYGMDSGQGGRANPNIIVRKQNG